MNPEVIVETILHSVRLSRYEPWKGDVNMKWGALVPPVEDVNAFPALLPGLPLELGYTHITCIGNMLIELGYVMLPRWCSPAPQQGLESEHVTQKHGASAL